MGGRTIAGDWYIASDAEMAMLAGNYEEAASLARAVVESSSAASLIRSWGIGERALGAALAHLGAEPLTVEQHMANAVRAFGLGQLELDIAQTHVMWSQCCRLRGDNEQAAHHLEEGKRRFVLGGCDAALTQIAQLAAMS